MPKLALHEHDRDLVNKASRLATGRQYVQTRINRLTEEGTEESLERAVALSDWLEEFGRINWPHS